MLEDFKNLKEEEAEPCQGWIKRRLEEEEERGESEPTNPTPFTSITEAAGTITAAETLARATPARGDGCRARRRGTC